MDPEAFVIIPRLPQNYTIYDQRIDIYDDLVRNLRRILQEILGVGDFKSEIDILIMFFIFCYNQYCSYYYAVPRTSKDIKLTDYEYFYKYLYFFYRHTRVYVYRNLQRQPEMVYTDLSKSI